jgi:hypothetical protein
VKLDLLREERRLSVVENRMLRRLCGPKRDKEQETGEYCMRSIIIYTLRLILLG